MEEKDDKVKEKEKEKEKGPVLEKRLKYSTQKMYSLNSVLSFICLSSFHFHILLYSVDINKLGWRNYTKHSDLK